MAKKSKARHTKPPPKLTIRRNGAPIEVTRNTAPIVPVRAASMRRNNASSQSTSARKKRASMKKHTEDIRAKHVLAFAAGDVAGTLASGIAVWAGLEPPTAGWSLFGVGATTTTLGYLAEHLGTMCVGGGLTMAGVSTLTHHYAFGTHDASETATSEQSKSKTETGKTEKPRTEHRNSGSRIRLVREHETH